MDSLRWFMHELGKQICIVIAAFLGVALVVLIVGLALRFLDGFGVLLMFVIVGAVGLKLLDR